MNTTFSRSRAAFAAICLAVVLTGLQPTVAQAVPAHCDGEDAPPQCHHLPPAPPPALRTNTFTPSAGENMFRAYAVGDPVALDRQSVDTTYRSWLECSNGYSHVFELRRADPGFGLLTSLEIKTNPGEVGGTCVFVTYDQALIGVSRTDVHDAGFLVPDGTEYRRIPYWVGSFKTP